MGLDVGKITSIVLSGAVGGVVALCGLWVMKPLADPPKQGRPEIIRPRPIMRVDGDVRSLRVGRSSDLSFHITAMINNRPVNMLVDTGANISVLTRQDAMAAGIPNVDTGSHMQVTGINRTVSTYRNTGTWNIGLGPIAISSVPIAVDDDGQLPNSILGMDALCGLDKIVIQNDSLEFQHGSTVATGCDGVVG